MKKLIRAVLLSLAFLGMSGAALAACVIQTINFGETKNGVLTVDDCIDHNGNGFDYYYDWYEFNGTAGQQIAISNSSTAIDPDLLLIMPDSTVANPDTIYDDDSGGGLNARIPASGFLTLTQTGTYAIVPSSAVPVQTGAYTLTLTLNSPPPPPPPAGCTVAAAPVSSSGSPLQAGTSVQLTASCTSGQQPITYTWDGGAATGSVRNVAPTTTTTYSMIASNAGGSAPAVTNTVYVAAPTPTGVPTVEFYNIDLRHYFLTAVQAEATGIDHGSAGPGWVRTGFSFDVFTSPLTAEVKALTADPVCRFYAPGANTHFFTVDAAECTLVKTDPGWHYEGIAFYVQPPQFGNCPTGTQPIYRAYNDRAAFNDSNHRFTTNLATFQQMGDQGWIMEGIVMCTTGVRAPTPVTGGTFKDPSGAGVTVAAGEIPPYVNATQPSMTPSPQLPPGLTIDPAQGEVNVTQGAPGYTFNLTGDSSFTTTTAGAVMVSLPFDASAIPVADQADPVKTFTRIFDPQDNSQVDLTGDIAISGSAGMLTVETRGLPRQFTAVVIYSPNMDAATSEEAAVADLDHYAPRSWLKVTRTTWPVQSWCIIWNHSDPNLIAAVRTLHGLAGNPTVAQIRADVVNLVGGGARRSQVIYQSDAMNAPNLFIGRTCRDGQSRYNVHLLTRAAGSAFQPNDPGEAISSGTDHFGRLYIDSSRLDDALNTPLGTVLASISHEMLHGVQNGYEILGGTPRGYREGSAATYGKSIDNGQLILVRDLPNETESLSRSLMSSTNPYGNQDFFAYVGKNNNIGSLNYLSGLYAQMRATIGSKVLNPSAATMYGAMDTSFKATFNQSLQAIYLDFVKQRALTHNAASQFGRAGEVVNGFAANLLGAANVFTQNVDISTCRQNRITLNTNGLPAFATTAIVISPTGVLPAGATSPTLAVKITPTASAIGLLWGGFTNRANVATALAANNKFPNFGNAAGDQVIVLVSNMNPASAGSFATEISCVGVTIDSIAPVKGPVGTTVTITGSGFGTAADTRSITFNGVTAAPTFNSDTQAVVNVPANASTGDVIVTVNGEKSNGVNFEVIAQCSATQNAGADTPDTRTIELGKPAGTFVFTWNTYSQEDEIIVFYQGITLFDTTCIGSSGAPSLHYSGTSTQITVQVIPNCKGGTGTAWDYSVSCP